MRLSLLGRGLRWRAGATLLGFLVSVVAVAGAAFGALFLHAADDSVLQSRLSAAAPGAAGLTLVSSGGRRALGQLAYGASLAPRPSQRAAWFGAPVVTIDTGVADSTTRPGDLFRADLLARTGVCHHVAFLAGSCPEGKDEIALSSRSAAAAHVRLGAVVPLALKGRPAPLMARVVGLYRAPRSEGAYWFGTDYFTFGALGSAASIELDPLVASRATLLAAGGGEPLSLLVQRPLLAGSLTSDDAAELSSRLGAYEASLRPLGLSAATSLTSLLSSVRGDEHLMGTVVWAIVAQLVLLSLLVLFAVVALSVAARSREAEIARLRGFPRLSLLAVALDEPLTVLLAAWPVGILAAWGAVALLAQKLFVAGVPVEFDPLALADAGAVLVAGVAACVAATRPLWSGQGSGRAPKRATGALEALAVALALAGLLALSAGGSLAGGRTDALAVAAPGLMALGAAVIGLHLARLGLRGALKVTAQSKRTASYLALRQVARRPAALRQALALTLATAIVVFAVAAWIQAGQSRSEVAAFGVGADRVLTVSVRPGTDLLAAVRHVDPTGRQAMAAEVYSSPSGTLLAVDAPRLARVAAWPSTLSPLPLGRLARRLTPPVAAPVVLSGDQVELVLDDRTALRPPPALALSLFDLRYQTLEPVTIASLRPGRHRYRLSLEGLCGDGCRLAGFDPLWSGSSPARAGQLVLALDSIRVRRGGGPWRAVALPGSAKGWKTVQSTVSAAPGRPVELRFPVDELAFGPSAGPDDVPSPLPAVVTDQLLAFNPPSEGFSVPIEGLDGASLDVAVEGTVPALPEVGADAALVDLALAQRAQSGPAVFTTDQVWLSASAPPSIVGRLEAAGVSVERTAGAAQAGAALDRSGLALAYAAFLVGAPLAVLLALGSTAFTMIVSGRRRRRELAGLAAVGVEHRVLVRSVVEESWLVLAIAAVLGAGVGVGAAALALGSLPELASAPTFPLVRSFPVEPVAVLVAVLLAVLAATGLAVALVLARPARRPRSGFDQP